MKTRWTDKYEDRMKTARIFLVCYLSDIQIPFPNILMPVVDKQTWNVKLK